MTTSARTDPTPAHHEGGFPMQSQGQPAELAGAYVYLASDEASFTSGAILPVTGGKGL